MNNFAAIDFETANEQPCSVCSVGVVVVRGGASGDWCVGATLAGKEIPRDGFSFSLLGAGGVQFNMTRHLGLYVEPEISWTLPSEKRVLETYRSAHPFLFSVATGLRINLDK